MWLYQTASKAEHTQYNNIPIVMLSAYGQQIASSSRQLIRRMNPECTPVTLQSRMQTDAERRTKMEEALRAGPRLVIDLDFGDYMTDSMALLFLPAHLPLWNPAAVLQAIMYMNIH